MFRHIFLLFLISIVTLFAKDKISLQLSMQHQFMFAGYYIAQEKGFYDSVELEVVFKQIKPNMNVIKEVQDKQSTLGITSSKFLINHANGTNIVLLSAILQSTPSVFVSLKSSKINTIKDFSNKKISIDKNTIDDTPLSAMININNQSTKNILLKNERYSLDKLINKKVDIQTLYLPNHQYALDKTNISYDIWDPKEYRLDFYDNILFTSEQEANKNKKRVEQFKQMSLKGWSYAFNNIEETINVIYLKYNTQNKTKEALRAEAKILKKYAYLKNTPLGNIDKKKLQTLSTVYKIMGKIEKDVSLTRLIFSLDNYKYENLFTNNEKNYLKNKKEISMCISPNTMPFENIKEGKHIGMVAQYIELFSNIIKIPFILVPTKDFEQSLENVKKRKCDIISLATINENKKNHFNFTAPYINTPMVIATKLNITFIDGLNSIKDKKIGILTNYKDLPVLQNNENNLDIVEVKSINEGLERVKNGDLFAYIGTIATVGSIIQSKYLGDLKVAGILKDKMTMGLAMRNDDTMLAQILNKTINSVDKNTYEKVFDKWISVKSIKEIDYELIKTILIIVFFVIAFFIYRQYTIRKTNKELEIRVAKEVKESRQKDILFQQQSKLATMGEMVANISHQWKQPISNINGIVMNMDYDYSNDTLSKKMFYDYLDELESTTEYMSNTIHNFMNFFSPTKGKQTFHIVKLIEDISTMLSSTLKTNHVKLNIIKENDLTLHTYKSELIQVMMVLINNAKEASVSNGIKDANIRIKHYQKDNKIIIDVTDNAGGIPEDILDRIFEPYFTTKHKSIGTGLGLHMAKDLIENALEGELICENIFDTNNKIKGAMFSIVLTIQSIKENM